jgi:GNAT superfamily N-acetyltransferase
MRIEKIDREKRTEALKLVLDVFMQYEAPDYAAEGIDTFVNFLHDESQIDALEMLGAFDGEKIVGVIATRGNGSHISLFFVDGALHRQGIGRQLFAEVLRRSPAQTISVNSSPFAVEAYRRLGFTPTGSEQVRDGIRFTPMLYHRVA